MDGFSAVTAILRDRDGTIYREIGLCRFWAAPPKVIVEGDSYYVRITGDDVIDRAEYRRTSAIHRVEKLK